VQVARDIAPLAPGASRVISFSQTDG
jgi:hypothetical protein